MNFKDTLKQYQQQVAYNKQNLPPPFFNSTDNTPIQWFGKLVADTKQRGLIEGMHDVTNPIIQNPAVYPYAEPLIGDVRMSVSRIPNQYPPTQFARKLLGLPPTINTLKKR